MAALLDIYLASVLLMFGIVFTVYISDIIRIKKVKLSFEPKDFLSRLKFQFLKQILVEKHVIFYACLFFCVIVLLMIYLQSNVKDDAYNMIMKNPSLINKTLEEKEKSIDVIVKNSNQVFNFIASYFFSVVILTFIIYFVWKIGKHLKIEESIKKSSLTKLLKSLEVDDLEIGFYKSIEKKFGKSKNKEIYESFANFVYETMEYKDKRRKKLGKL